MTGYPIALMATTISPGLWQLDQTEADAPSGGDLVPSSATLDERVVDELVGIAEVRGLVLELIDRGFGPQRRCRFYALYLQPALFGCCHLVRSWGRVAKRRSARQLLTCHTTVEGARAALRPVVRRRLRRGYQPSAQGGP